MNRYELLLNHNYSKVICTHTNYGQNVAVEDSYNSFEHYEWSGFVERSLALSILKDGFENRVSQFFGGGCYREQGIDSWVYPQSGYSLLAFVSGKHVYSVVSNGKPCWTNPELFDLGAKPTPYRVKYKGEVVDISRPKK